VEVRVVKKVAVVVVVDFPVMGEEISVVVKVMVGNWGVLLPEKMVVVEVEVVNREVGEWVMDF
jgi:hypothetical protein